jgi:hypothetical protein
VFLCGFDACGPPNGGFWCPKAAYFTSLLSFCISPATISENRRDLRCFFERFFRVLLFLAINFGLMSRLESHFWPACRRFLKLSVFHFEKGMNVSGKIAPLAGLPCLP